VIVHRGVLLLIAAFCAALLTIPPARAQSAGVPVVVLDGKGWGHGVGLSQWGARYMADAGATHDQILSTFYPGTKLTKASPATIRVAVFSSPAQRTTWVFPSGGEVRSAPTGDQAAGFPMHIAPGGAVVVTFDGAYHVTPAVTAQAATRPAVIAASDSDCIPILGQCPKPGGGGSGCGALGCVGGDHPAPPTTSPPTTADPAPTDAPPTSATAPPTTQPLSSGGPVWAAPVRGGTVGVADRGRHYRGLIEATAAGGPLRVVNQLDVETYVKGMAEVPGNWPGEAIGAQSIVARTYALRAMAANGELCDYDLCQVYVGADNESAGQSAAVAATAGQILTYGGALAATVYSADAGGTSATPLEGFGTPDGTYPYLTAVHYDTPNPLPWHNEIALTDVASRLGYAGTLRSVSIQQAGPSGRALVVQLDGTRGATTVSGRDFAAKLGLRSTLFTPALGSSATAPAAPAAGRRAPGAARRRRRDAGRDQQHERRHGHRQHEPRRAGAERPSLRHP